jgi:hypothetical protein
VVGVQHAKKPCKREERDEYIILYIKVKKSKGIPVIGRGGP